MMPRPSGDGLDNGYPQSFGRNSNRSQPNFQNPSGYSHDNEQQLRQRFSMVGASAPPTLSPHAGGGGAGMDQGMMPNQQQQQQMGYSGNRHEMSGNSPNTSSINAMGGGGHGHQQQYQLGDLSPTLAHRMQMNAGGMGSSGMYQQMANNPSPNANFGSAMEMDSRGLTPTGPAGGGGGPPAASTTTGGSLSQADREEELLLNLLIARRQRGSRMSADGGRNAQSLADELMRLRQSRSQASGNAMGQSSRGSQMPPVPGLPPLYTEPGGSNAYAGNMGGGSGAGGGGSSGGLPSYEAYVRQSSDHMMSAMQDASERIDRPSRMLDARSQDAMRDFSGRGLKRSAHMGGSMEFGNLKYPTAMGMQSYEVAPVKKKRTHKKKPADMPRRPLSAYNLFFSEERERILKEIDVKEGVPTTTADTTSKDEDTAKEEGATEATEGEDDADTDKPKALQRPLIPAQKKRRPHRKTHGKISFQQLARMVGERWKALPDDQRKYYQGLAEADMKRQKVAMEEYYAKNASKELSKEGTKDESKEASKEEGDAEMETEKETEKEEKRVVVEESKAVGVGL
jgi:hypothetical protein